MSVTPYLFFDGRCEEAVEFYKKALGAQVGMLMRFKESPDPNSAPPGAGEKIMHTTLTINGQPLMASDGHAKGQPKFEGFGLSLDYKNEADVQKAFKALSEGGKVQMPLTETFFAKSFGMVADKFGIMWMLIVEKK
jgi:PhnB protein